MKSAISLIIGLLLPVSLFAAMACQEGKDYEVIQRGANSAQAGKITVTEFFSYDCPACNNLELNKNFSDWKKNLPEHVEFNKVPVVFASQWKNSAAAYYMAEALGQEEQLSPEIFNTIHGNDGNRKKPLRNRKAIGDLFLAQGAIDAETASSPAFTNSPTIEAKIKEAEALRQRYGVGQVPTIVVNGQYQTNPTMAGDYKKMLAIVDCLIEKEDDTSKNN